MIIGTYILVSSQHAIREQPVGFLAIDSDGFGERVLWEAKYLIVFRSLTPVLCYFIITGYLI